MHTINKRTLRIFSAASFLNDLGSDMISPVWPLFVTRTLGASMTVLGVIDGLGEALVSISQAASGYLSDRMKRRKVFIWSGYLMGAVSRAGYAASGTWQHLIPCKILDRAGKMRGAPRDAFIADISSDKDRGRNFGLLRAMDNLGAVCGILVCILLFERLGFRSLFLLAAIPSAVGALLIFTLVKERSLRGRTVFKGLTFRAFDRNFMLFLLLSALFALGSFSYSFLLILAKQFGAEMRSVPLFYLLFSAVASISALPFGRLSDRIGRKPVLMGSYLLWGGVLSCFLVSRDSLPLILAFVLYGLHRGALEPVQKTFVSELSPERLRASILGGFQMVTGLCALPSLLLAVPHPDLAPSPHPGEREPGNASVLTFSGRYGIFLTNQIILIITNRLIIPFSWRTREERDHG
jgi:MFS family permease